MKAHYAGCELGDKCNCDAIDDSYDEPDDQCHFCCGEGYVDGEELGDPGWYLPGEIYKCTCCGGSGEAKDCTFW